MIKYPLWSINFTIHDYSDSHFLNNRLQLRIYQYNDFTIATAKAIDVIPFVIVHQDLPLKSTN
jgi:hypothetical protein